jgi:hypothetical protein
MTLAIPPLAPKTGFPPRSIRPLPAQPVFGMFGRSKTPLETINVSGNILGKSTRDSEDDYGNGITVYELSVGISSSIAAFHNVEKAKTFEVGRATYNSVRDGDPVDLLLVPTRKMFGGIRHTLTLDETAVIESAAERKKGWLPDDVRRLSRRLAGLRREFQKGLAELKESVTKRVDDFADEHTKALDELGAKVETVLGRAKALGLPADDASKPVAEA